VETDEELETGYGPATPGGDNLCNDYVHGLATSLPAVAEARGERVRRDGELALTLVDAGVDAMLSNVVVVERPLSEAEWRSAAAGMHEFYGGRPGGPFLVFSAWPTPDLSADDFGRVGHPPLMVRMPAALDVAPVDGLEVRPVEDAATAADWERVIVDGFPEPGLQPAQVGCLLPEPVLRVERRRHWVGYLGGRAVGAASAWQGDHHVDVALVATLPEARGRGVGRAMTATATLAETGLPAHLIASDLGRSVYEGLGYRALLRFTLWAGHRRP
jgi:GNAT superfamily N-acetyltransferase